MIKIAFGGVPERPGSDLEGSRSVPGPSRRGPGASRERPGRKVEPKVSKVESKGWQNLPKVTKMEPEDSQRTAKMDIKSLPEDVCRRGAGGGGQHKTSENVKKGVLQIHRCGHNHTCHPHADFTKNGRSKLCVSTPIVTLFSCIASNKAD